MSRVALLSCVAFLAACSKGEQTSTADSSHAEHAASISLADVAGTWNFRTMAMGSDSVLVTSQLVATGTTDGWTLTLQGREPQPVRVLEVAGDSIVTEVGPYESVLRPGVQVTVRQVVRKHGDMLMGSIAARYQGATADSVVNLRSEGTKAR